MLDMMLKDKKNWSLKAGSALHLGIMQWREGFWEEGTGQKEPLNPRITSQVSAEWALACSGTAEIRTM